MDGYKYEGKKPRMEYSYGQYIAISLSGPSKFAQRSPKGVVARQSSQSARKHEITTTRSDFRAQVPNKLELCALCAHR